VSAAGALLVRDDAGAVRACTSGSLVLESVP
jgi:hypothetical protein